MEEEKKQKEKKISKKMLFLVLSVLLIGGVFATALLLKTHYLSDITVTEAFDVQFAVVNEGTVCSDAGTWITGDKLKTNLGGFFPGEGRLVCIKISNGGSKPLKYAYETKYTGDDVAACVTAFGEEVDMIDKPIAAGATVTEVLSISIAENAPPLSTPCGITIEVGRGSGQIA